MNQTKLESIIETLFNVGSGMVLATLVWQFIMAPAFGYESTLTKSFTITCVFTAVAVARGYFWRRFFNAGLHKVIHKTVTAYATGRLSRIWRAILSKAKSSITRRRNASRENSTGGFGL